MINDEYIHGYIYWLLDYLFRNIHVCKYIKLVLLWLMFLKSISQCWKRKKLSKQAIFWMRKTVNWI